MGRIKLRPIDQLDTGLTEDRLVQLVQQQAARHTAQIRSLSLLAIAELDFAKHPHWPEGFFDKPAGGRFLDAVVQIVSTDDDFLRKIIRFNQCTHWRNTVNRVLKTGTKLAAASVFWDMVLEFIGDRDVEVSD